ncbi:MAG: hypothetical protein IKV90_08065 [Clostridia bacterium]|nr:hypothetical protein [Clostridia bacterium]
MGALLFMERCAEGKNLFIAQRAAVVFNANEEIFLGVLKGQLHYRALRRDAVLDDVFNQLLKEQHGSDVGRQGVGRGGGYIWKAVN